MAGRDPQSPSPAIARRSDGASGVDRRQSLATAEGGFRSQGFGRLGAGRDPLRHRPRPPLVRMLRWRWRWRQLRRKVLWLWSQEGSPSTLARGLAAGVFTGCLPFFGLQIVLGVALASAMRGNRLLAAAGTWISNPLTTVPMCWLNYQLGVVLLGPGPAWPGVGEIDGETISRLGWSFTSRLLLGSLVIGGVAAAVCWVVCWHWLHRRERRQGRSIG